MEDIRSVRVWVAGALWRQGLVFHGNDLRRWHTTGKGKRKCQRRMDSLRTEDNGVRRHQAAWLAPGSTILINGVGGGVGIAAAQLARREGLKVLGTASEVKQRFVESRGVTHVAYGDGVIDRVKSCAPEGIHGLFDVVGGPSLRTLGSLPKDRSRIITTFDDATVAALGGSRVL
jgi:NADPH:quinone reductase-like Zn-dependent oxidoreductase